jgi:hypothetical protein
MGDYKAVDGILFPHKSSMSLGPQELDLITQSIELNSTLDPSIFN